MTLRSKDRDQDRSAAKPIAAQRTTLTAINNVRFAGMPHSLKVLPNDHVHLARDAPLATINELIEQLRRNSKLGRVGDAVNS